MTFDEMYESCREGVRRVIIGVDPAIPGEDRTVYHCHTCGNDLPDDDGPPHCAFCLLNRD